MNFIWIIQVFHTLSPLFCKLILRDRPQHKIQLRQKNHCLEHLTVRFIGAKKYLKISSPFPLWSQKHGKNIICLYLNFHNSIKQSINLLPWKTYKSDESLCRAFNWWVYKSILLKTLVFHELIDKEIKHKDNVKSPLNCKYKCFKLTENFWDH